MSGVPRNIRHGARLVGESISWLELFWIQSMFLMAKCLTFLRKMPLVPVEGELLMSSTKLPLTPWIDTFSRNVVSLGPARWKMSFQAPEEAFWITAPCSILMSTPDFGCTSPILYVPGAGTYTSPAGET